MPFLNVRLWLKDLVTVDVNIDFHVEVEGDVDVAVPDLWDSTHSLHLSPMVQYQEELSRVHGGKRKGPT